jgi:hypothetical protein
MILERARDDSGEGLATFYDGPMDRNALAKQAVLLGPANTNAMAFLRRAPISRRPRIRRTGLSASGRPIRRN